MNAIFLMVASDKKKFPARLLTGITVLLLILAGSPFFDIEASAAKKGSVQLASNPYAAPSIYNLTSSDPTSSGSFVFWDTNVSSNNRVYYGLNQTDVNNLVNGSYSIWYNNTVKVNIRLSGLAANTTYHYKPESWASGIVNNSVRANALTTLKPGVWVSPSEYMVSPAGWMGSPANFRTVNISAAVLDSNGRYISGLSPEAVIYNSTGFEIGRTTLSGAGPYSGNFVLPDYLDEGGYIVRITGYPIAGEFSVLKWSCANCHSAGGSNYPSAFDAATVHPEHFDTTDINVEHPYSGDIRTSTSQCGDCHSSSYPNWVAHPSAGECSDCHKSPSGTNAALACENCHSDKTTTNSVLSPRYGTDKHQGQACSNCHGTISLDPTSLTPKPSCTSCHPRPDSSLTSVPPYITNKSHSREKTVACALCHNREHDVKSLTLDAKTCRNCHTGINHDGGAQCTTCHGSDPHEITFAGGETCVECHGTNYTGANPMARTTLVDVYAFNESIHQNINATPPDTVNNNDCWSCHYNKDMRRENIRKCGDCHSKPKQWHGNANVTTNLSELW